MNMKLTTTVFIACFSATTIAANIPPQRLMDTYPPSEKGMKRQVITLSVQKDESVYKIELIPGQMMMTDCNQTHITGELQRKTKEGWGYDYYIFKMKPGSSVSTRMACLANSKSLKFVSAHLNDTGFIRYNSRLPVVIYTPDNIDIRYRIWKTSEQLENAEIQ